MTRTTKNALAHLVIEVQREARALGIIDRRDTLILEPSDKATGRPYRLHLDGARAFTPADGNAGDIGRTAREAEHTLRIMWHTLRAARKAVGK